MAAGTPAAPPPQESWPDQSLPASCSCRSGGLFGQSLQRCPFRHLEGSLAEVLPCRSAGQARRGAPLAGVLLCKLAHQALKGRPGWVFPCRSAGQAFDGPASLLFSCQCHRLGGERLGSPPAQPLHLSLCSHSSPRPGVAAQPLNSSSQPCAFQEIRVPLRGVYGCGKDRLILIPFRLPRISSFTLSLECFSSDSDNCPDVGIGPLLRFPHQLGAGPVLPTPLVSSLVPSSYRAVRGSIYSFPLVRSPCPFSTGVLHTLLCLKVCS